MYFVPQVFNQTIAYLTKVVGVFVRSCAFTATKHNLPNMIQVTQVYAVK
jgi:hypothetical protein